MPPIVVRADAPAPLVLDPLSVFQPDPAKIESYAHIDTDDADPRARGNKLRHGSIPYTRYREGWHFHPARIGHQLATLAGGREAAAALADAVQQHFVELPNGGLALYYPKTFPNVRLRCAEYIYSGLAQGQLLAGFARLIREPGLAPGRKAAWKAAAEKLALSLRFPFEKGGVSIGERIVLEASNFRAPPEISLNGWLYALLCLDRYIQDTGDGAQGAFLQANFAALAQLLPLFDDAHLRLSKYSTASPYVVRIRYARARAGAKPPKVRLHYAATQAGVSGFVIGDLWTGEGLPGCIYENKIMQWDQRSVDVAITSSSLFHLILDVEADAATLETNAGTYRPRSSSPGKAGAPTVIAPVTRSADRTVFHLPSGLLLAGHPTNFGKAVREDTSTMDGGGNSHPGRANRNFYHCYHVVALLELLPRVNDAAVRAQLGGCALQWLDYMEHPNPAFAEAGHLFASPARVVAHIAATLGTAPPASFEALAAAARAHK